MRAQLEPWVQHIPSGPAIAALFRGVPMPGGTVPILLPPAETRPVLTDLVVYFFIVLTLAIALNLHLKLRSAHEMATELARAIALLNSKAPNESRLPIGAAVDICRNDEP
jgi:hypothetical protein